MLFSLLSWKILMRYREGYYFEKYFSKGGRRWPFAGKTNG
jgi:hypothetical protein